MKYNGTLYYYIYILNAQGDVVQIVNSSRSAVASYTYDPWGKVISSSGTLADINPLRYRGYYYDAETGFYYLQSRYYDPEIGRFINADSYASTDATGLLSTNMFAYCENDPVNKSDPSGKWMHIVAGAVFGGISSLLDGLADNKSDATLLRTVLIGMASGALSAAFPGCGLAIDVAANCIDAGLDLLQSNEGQIAETVFTSINSTAFSAFSNSQEGYLTTAGFSDDIEAIKGQKNNTKPGNHLKVKARASKNLSSVKRTIIKKGGRDILSSGVVGAVRRGVNLILKSIF
jgi:RHS repeat-associated protein